MWEVMNGRVYQVVKYWPEKGKSGFLVWRYLLKRNDDEPAPWTRDGKERMKKLGLTMQVTSARFHPFSLGVAHESSFSGASVS